MIRAKTIVLSVTVLLSTIFICGCFTTFSVVRRANVTVIDDVSDYEVFVEPVSVRRRSAWPTIEPLEMTSAAA